ncbi:MAG: TIM barrel protein [Verrucomicrobiae bacterium]|nr:TIM barrel protein [Verrucomicrobiae bacterium]
MLSELEGLGFRAVELGHGIRQTLVEGVLKYLGRGTLRVTSLHNFCPLPIEVLRSDPDCLEFSARDGQARRRAVRMTRETVDFAKEVGAGVVVLHLGSVGGGEAEWRVMKEVKRGGIYGRRHVAAKLAALRRRELVVGEAWAGVHECLGEIVPYAKERGVRLAAECRSSIFELPLETEWEGLLGRYPEGDLGYWHDFGHMQRKEGLTFGDHWEALSSRCSRILGAHVHDAGPVKDHRPIGEGRVAWGRLLPLLPEGIPLVLEMSPKVEAEDVVASRERLAAMLGGHHAGE